MISNAIKSIMLRDVLIISDRSSKCPLFGQTYLRLQASDEVILYEKNEIVFFLLDEIRRTLGEGTFGKVVEVRDLRE